MAISPLSCVLVRWSPLQGRREGAQRNWRVPSTTQKHILEQALPCFPQSSSIDASQAVAEVARLDIVEALECIDIVSRALTATTQATAELH